MVKKGLTDKEIQKYYDENIFGDIRTKHILISIDTLDGMTTEEKNNKEKEALNKAKDIIKKLNNGEDPQKTAVRELEEECGLVATDIKKIFEIYPTPGYSAEKIHIYFVKEFLPEDQQNMGNINRLFNLLDTPAESIGDALTILKQSKLDFEYRFDPRKAPSSLYD